MSSFDWATFNSLSASLDHDIQDETQAALHYRGELSTKVNQLATKVYQAATSITPTTVKDERTRIQLKTSLLKLHDELTQMYRTLEAMSNDEVRHKKYLTDLKTAMDKVRQGQKF